METMETKEPVKKEGPKKRKRTPKEEREANLEAYMGGAMGWTIEADGLSLEVLQELWSAFLTECGRLPTTQPLNFITPSFRLYKGFGRLGASTKTDISFAPTLPPLTTGLVALEDLALSKDQAIRILSSKTLTKGTALAVRYYLDGSYLAAKKAKTLASKQARLETRLLTKLAKANHKYKDLVGSINEKLMDPTKDFIKCGACGSRYPRTALSDRLPHGDELYTCVLCDKPLTTLKEKERLAAAADGLLVLKEAYRREVKAFGWLIRI